MSAELAAGANVDGSQAASSDETLKVHPSVIFKLGEDLITDEIQALVELIKNSYDADSTWVRLRIDTREETRGIDGYGNATQESARGVLTLEDGGTGMSRDQIVAGWLTVSNSWKRAFKEQRQVTQLGRTPLGDKGLGRLGAQRLGDFLEIETRPADSLDAWAVSIPWRAYETVASLDAVVIQVRPIPRGTTPQGTKITIRGLSPRFIELAKPQNLVLELSKMVSPFDGNKDFDLRVTLDGTALDLHSLSARVRSSAEVHYELDYAEGKLLIRLTMDYRILKSNQPEQAGEFYQWIEPDRGAAFSKWLLSEKAKRADGFGLSAGSASSLISGAQEIDVLEHSELAVVDSQFADPGPFHGEIEAVDLDEDRANAFASRTQYVQYVKEIGGVRIYRDGFAVRTDPDWLGLNKRWSTGRSYYGIRPNTVLGYVNITARENEQLTETTNREGFQKTPALANFMRIMDLWLNYTDKFQEFVRRSYLEYVAQMSAVSSKLPPALPPAEAARRIEAVLKRSDAIRGEVGNVSRSVSELLAGNPEGPSVLPILTDSDVTDILGRLRRLVDQVDAFSVELEVAKRDVATVRESIETTRTQLADVWQTVAVGLSAESVAHEIRNVLDVLRGRTQAARKHAKSVVPAHADWNIYLEYVDSATRALRQQLSHIEPGLRYARDRKETFGVGTFVREQVDFYRDSAAEKNAVSFDIDIQNDFEIRGNRGRLSQTIDNLMINSLYWLSELRRRTDRPGTIHLVVDAPFLTFSDNGPGIAPSIEANLFEPFVTLKPSGSGRGLGLYVVAQLLDTDEISIDLGPERDSDGRFRSFRLDFSAAIAAAADR